ncbi:uncharacterized protein LOC113359387 [Papaver somniferum]|uniref:uncharacterized protein LOC113359387 n=1 Tax=Papaver somniferum TaxID=3469 RepID=UPI000E704D55|nr:uncharacterized protein LOC113359387 [Papaver somniferum]
MFSIGTAGGLVVAWHKSTKLRVLHIDNNQVNCSIWDENTKSEWILTCMYGSPYKDSRKDEPWKLVNQMGETMNMPWLVLGDLNVILHKDEKRGGNPANDADIRKFSAMFNNLGLKDLGFIGFPFTWSIHQDGDSHIEERLDRGMENGKWITQFPNTSLRHLNHSGSDHSVVLLNTSIPCQNGSKPFKFFGLYQEEQKCRDIIKSSWHKNFNGSTTFILVNRLANVKKEVSLWNKFEFGKIKHNLVLLNRKLETIIENPNIRLNDQNLLDTKAEIQKLDDYEEEFWKIKGSDDRNNIWIEGRDNIANCLNVYFETLLTTSRPVINNDIVNLVPPSITDTENSKLMEPPSEIEIHDALFGMPPNCSPGPDGFPSCLFQKNWNIVKKDVIETILAFFNSGHMLTKLNSTYIFLIPKVLHPNGPSYYRPISSCNIVYKIISKVIPNRIKPFLDRLISPYQSAFVKQRLISDNLLVAHEIIHAMRKKRKSKTDFMGLKIDMSKSFDRVEWNFLIVILRRMGFCDAWCNLIYQCISTCQSDILVNGVP